VRHSGVNLMLHSDEFYLAMLDRLRAVTAAFVKSDTGPQGCLPGTRKKILDDIMDWFADDGPSVYWLRGLAGTGKTTIARSVADLAEQQGLLGASFFFLALISLVNVLELSCRRSRTSLQNGGPPCASLCATQSTPTGRLPNVQFRSK
jgi:hypothetical protein